MSAARRVGRTARGSRRGAVAGAVLALALALSGCAVAVQGQTPQQELDYRDEFIDPERLGFEPVSPIRQSFEPEGLPVRERLPKEGLVVGGAGDESFDQALSWVEADDETKVDMSGLHREGQYLVFNDVYPEDEAARILEEVGPYDAWITLTTKPSEATLDRLRTESKERILLIWGGTPATFDEIETVSEAIFDAFTAGGLPLAAAEPNWTETEFVINYRLAQATDIDLEQHARAAAEAGTRASEDGKLPMPVHFDYQSSMEETDDYHPR